MSAWLGRSWRWLRQPSGRFAAGTLLGVGGIAGIIFWGGFNTALEATNSLEFCISCHEMESNWAKGAWTITIRRKHDTGHKDDIALVPGQTIRSVWRCTTTTSRRGSTT